MPRGYRTEGEERWMRGFFNALEKGRAAADDPAFKESDNPYKMYEHRRMWHDGFRERRSEIAAEALSTVPGQGT